MRSRTASANDSRRLLYRAEMLPDSVRKVIASGPLAHITTLTPSGAPHVTLAWIGLDGDEVVFGMLADQPKLRNIRRDPRIAISLHTANTNAFGLADMRCSTDARPWCLAARPRSCSGSPGSTSGRMSSFRRCRTHQLDSSRA